MRGSKFTQLDDTTWGEDTLLLRVRTAIQESKEGRASVKSSHFTSLKTQCAHALQTAPVMFWVVLIAFLSWAVHQPCQFAVRMLSIAPP